MGNIVFYMYHSPRTERLKYYKHAQKARKHPEKYISLIIDGMDQKSTSIPKFYRTSKSLSAAWRLPSHITGTIVHGRGQHMFVDTKEFPHDSNLTSTILLQVSLYSIPPLLSPPNHTDKQIPAICQLM